MNIRVSVNHPNVSPSEVAAAARRRAMHEHATTCPRSDQRAGCSRYDRLIHYKGDIEVHADGGIVFVKTKADVSSESKLTRDIERIAGDIPGVKEVRVVVSYPGIS